MTLPNPVRDNYWRNRLLTEEEYVETLKAAQAVVDEETEKAKKHRETVKAFLAAMESMGFPRASAEYKYVSSRVVPRARFSQSLIYNIEEAQRNLRKKAEETKQQAVEMERHRKEVAELIEEARMLGVDPLAYFGDEKALRAVVNAAWEVKFEESLMTAPYYVVASFYGHCLRADWSEGRHSYGCRELRELSIPAEDTEHPELHALAKELQKDADNWEGDDGRYFRDTYQRLDALLSEEDAKLLTFLDEVRGKMYYGF